MRFSSCLVCDCGEDGRAVGSHHGEQLVGDAGDGERFFLVGADDVVVERRAEHDVAARLLEVGRFVDDDRRIAGAGADRPLAALHRRLDDARPAGDDDQANAGMHHERLGRFLRRLGHRHDQVRRPADFDDRPVDDVDAADRALFGRRMDVEHDRVAGGDHRDRVVDDRRRGIRAGRDRADDAERGALEQRQAAVARLHFGLQHFGAGRFVGHEPVLDDLVFVAAEAGLLMRGKRQRLAFLERPFADVGDDLVALGERELVQGFEGGSCRLRRRRRDRGRRPDASAPALRDLGAAGSGAAHRRRRCAAALAGRWRRLVDRRAWTRLSSSRVVESATHGRCDSR